MAYQVGGEVCAQGCFVVDVLGVGLEEGERLLHLPGPMSGVKDLALLARLGWAHPAQDVADGVGREVQSPPPQV
jgi:hypothetical protein